MYRQLSFLRSLKSEVQRVQNLYDQLLTRSHQLPEGHLSCRKGHLYRIVHTPEKVEQLIIPADWEGSEQLIKDLQERRYISKALPILKNNLKNLKRCLDRFQIYDPEAIRNGLPAYYSDFDTSPLLLAGDIDPKSWEASSYAKNTCYLKHLKNQSEGGLRTRSKAEADIATKLEQNHLQFRYEPLLCLGTHTVSPDFCVIHPLHRRQIYWEHFGSMDDPKYANDTMEKLRLYAQHGYLLGDNLIMTWETKENPLTFKHINDRIKTYFFN